MLSAVHEPIEANRSVEFQTITGVLLCSSWDQMGQYDAPAMIDYILETTGQEQIFWVGHSMGAFTSWRLS